MACIRGVLQMVFNCCHLHIKRKYLPLSSFSHTRRFIFSRAPCHASFFSPFLRLHNSLWCFFFFFSYKQFSLAGYFILIHIDVALLSSHVSTLANYTIAQFAYAEWWCTHIGTHAMQWSIVMNFFGLPFSLGFFAHSFVCYLMAILSSCCCCCYTRFAWPAFAVVHRHLTYRYIAWAFGIHIAFFRTKRHFRNCVLCVSTTLWKKKRCGEL